MTLERWSTNSCRPSNLLPPSVFRILQHYVGGKHDDISVLVAVVGDRDLPSEEVSPPSSNSSTSSSSSSASSDSNSSSHVNASSKNSNLSLGGHSSSTRSFSQL